MASLASPSLTSRQATKERAERCGLIQPGDAWLTGYEEFRDDLAVAYLANRSPSSGALLGRTLLPFQIRKLTGDGTGPRRGSTAISAAMTA
jgi:hypothetical protein